MTYRILALLAAALTFLTAGTLTRPEPAQAAQPYVIVQEGMTLTWDSALRTAIADLNRHTGRTNMKIGQCDSGHRCIIVRFGTPSTAGRVGECGPSCGPTRHISTITIRKTWPGWNRAGAQKRLLIHELAHAHDVDAHNRSCTSVMYRNVYCKPGKLNPYRLTPAELRILARQ